ncbi:MAG TPA: hypothetical protein VM574_07325 [Terrimicrobiaceae bacterium]|nr:hypothetical protein [Terrimicrobiaceae bacterium]
MSQTGYIWLELSEAGLRAIGTIDSVNLLKPTTIASSSSYCKWTMRSSMMTFLP